MTTTKTRADNTAETEIAQRVMHAMIVKGLTRRDLSTKTGIKYTTLRRSLDQDREDSRSFTVAEVVKLAAAMEVPPSLLMPAEFTATQDAA